nr:hypothetical protein [Bacteroidota bacterium]
MNFEKGYLYHIYNQGNNNRKLFFNRDNYLYFLGKIKTHIAPYADILAWCLMPNHFHLMVLVRDVTIDISQGLTVMDSDTMTPSHRITSPTRQRTINNSISIMLRSYTRAINIQENMSGSLFKAHTKAECINCPSGISPSFITKNGITKINIKNPEQQYSQVCFTYIHQNPVKANMVENATDWELSSARDYAGLRNGKLVNKGVARDYQLVF